VQSVTHRQRRWVGIVVVSVVVVVGVALSVQATVDEPVARPVRGSSVPGGGEAAPEFVLESLRDPDQSVSLGDFRGTPLVVNFFASWCAPCRREMPAFQAAYRLLQDDVRFLGIDNQDIRGDGLALVRESGVRYELAFDPDGTAARSFGIRGMPTTVFVAADGTILERVTGEMTQRDLRRTVRRLFGV